MIFLLFGLIFQLGDDQGGALRGARLSNLVNGCDLIEREATANAGRYHARIDRGKQIGCVFPERFRHCVVRKNRRACQK